MRITPPTISKDFDGSFLKNEANQNPPKDMINDIIPMISVDDKSRVWVSFRVIPEAKASILVAIPIAMRHFKSIQQTFSSCS